MPYRTRTLHSPLTAPEVAERLRHIVRPRRTFWQAVGAGFGRRPREAATFAGVVTDTSFRISRIIGYENAFLPVVRGQFSENGHGGTTIRLSLSLHPAVAAFMMIWFAGVSGILAAALTGKVASEGPVNTVSVGMLAFGIALVCAGFYPEALRAERTIRTAVAADA